MVMVVLLLTWGPKNESVSTDGRDSHNPSHVLPLPSDKRFFVPIAGWRLSSGYGKARSNTNSCLRTRFKGTTATLTKSHWSVDTRLYFQMKHFSASNPKRKSQQEEEGYSPMKGWLY